MKPVFIRRQRRRTTAKSEGAFFKKDSQETFFGGGEHETFFHPSATPAAPQAVQRKCEECESEENDVQRQSDKKEEEKVMKAPDKKEEEKKVQKAEDKKEEEKKVQKAEDKKEGEKKVQKVEDKKEEEKKVMKAPDKKEEEKKIQKAEDKKEEEKKVQKKENASSTGSTKSVSSYIGSLNGKGQSLAPATNRLFSSKMGYDFSNVKIHTDKAAAESAKGINAKAYATGNNIVFSEGQFDMESQQGKRLMAHELTHIIQQNPDVQREPVDAGVPIAGVPDKSAIAKELEEVWYTKGKDAFIDRVKKLRPEERGDMDTHVFILNNLPGDERWYAETLLFWGPEYGWSFEQKIELELKSLPQSKGYAGVSSLLKGASTSEKKTILKSFLTRMKILFSKQDFAKLMVDIDIPALISGAGNSEKLWILNDEPLMILLKQEFSQGQFNKLVKDLINLSHLPAGVLQDTVADLLYSPEEIDRNTAKGLINQRLTVYYFESLTHASDEADVLKKNGYDAAKYSVYNSPPGSKGPLIVPHNAMGFWIQGTSVIVGYQSRSLADWKIILVHETNHALNPVSGLDPVKNYITEFRAYWVSTYRGVANPDDRASQIKAHILKEYPLISEPYNKKADVKKAIDAYTRPDGNLLNK